MLEQQKLRTDGLKKASDKIRTSAIYKKKKVSAINKQKKKRVMLEKQQQKKEDKRW